MYYTVLHIPTNLYVNYMGKVDQQPLFYLQEKPAKTFLKCNQTAEVESSIKRNIIQSIPHIVQLERELKVLWD